MDNQKSKTWKKDSAINKRKRTNPENTTQKTKDQATQIPTKTEVNSGASEGLGILAVHAPFVTPVVLLLSIVLHTNIHI
jgi:hypothetical protein